MPPGHQQAGGVGPEGSAGQHFGCTAQIHDKAGIQLALLHPIGYGVIAQQTEPHLNMRVLLAEFVQLCFQPGQIIRYQRDTDADADGLGRLDLGVERRLHFLELFNHWGGMPLQAHAPVGEGKLVVGADEERPAQFGFQCGDALPQRLTRQKQPLGGAGIIHLFAQDQKIVQLADIHELLLKAVLRMHCNILKNNAVSVNCKEDGNKKHEKYATRPHFD